MASSVYKSINRTRCIRTSVNYNILLVYRNQPKHCRTIMTFSSLQLTRTPSLKSKLNASTKIRISHYRAGLVLSAGTANWRFFLRGMPLFSDTVTYDKNQGLWTLPRNAINPCAMAMHAQRLSSAWALLAVQGRRTRAQALAGKNQGEER